jgi:DNA-binding response OmpR family regulator
LIGFAEVRRILSKEKSKLLIIEDDLDVADMLNAYFRVQGYEVYTSNWGEDGVRAVEVVRPDLILLDIRLPDIDGYEVARRLRADRKTNNIPIIFLTERRDRADRLQGLELGADDYITKPFDVQELRLRVRNTIRRAGLDTLTNPVTGLPEGDVVLEHMSECLKKPDWAMVLISLHNMDDFREQYGFVASDDAIRAVSLMINNVMQESETREKFLGQISSTDFLLIVDPIASGSLEDRVHTRLEQALDYFYPIKDRSQTGSITNRLEIKSSILEAGDGRFETTDELKAELVRRKK